MRLFLDKTHARGARICYPYVRLAFRRGECLYHRTLGVGLFGDSDAEYMKNSVRGSANIVLGRWIDADDHMYIENLAAGEKQCPPFCQ